MTSLQLSEKAPPNWGLHPCYHCGLPQGMQRGDSPTPLRDPALSARVTTGGLSAPVTRWKARCHLLWIDGSRPPVHAPLLGIHVEEPQGSHNGRKANSHFPARQWSSFLSYLSLPVPGPMTTVVIQGKSGQPLER
jgi:hypothetical protein